MTDPAALVGARVWFGRAVAGGWGRLLLSVFMVSMVIAVIERRGEIGLRRSLGATRAHIRRQFLTEAVILSVLGGIGGVIVGVSATYIYATSQGWRVVIPQEAALGGFFGAIAIGAIAGLYPAMRAAKLAPTEALRS